MQFEKYPKIRRLGTAETAGILEGFVYVQEKVDGANASIWYGDGAVQRGSRNQALGTGSFRGFGEWATARTETLSEMFAAHPTARLYGEWLVPHTIRYSETSYNDFYLFDVVLDDGAEWLDVPAVNSFAETWGLTTPHYHGRYENPCPDALRKLAGDSKLGPKGEGVVLKNPTFVNKFGDRQYAKIVTESFKESNGVVFGGNNKHAESYWEIYVMNKYMTAARVKKVVQKLTSLLDHDLTIADTGRVINTAYHDLLTEEIWAIQKQKGLDALNLKILAKVCQRKAARLFHDLLQGFNSVAYEVDSVCVDSR